MEPLAEITSRMAERPEDLNLPTSVVSKIIKVLDHVEMLSQRYSKHQVILKHHYNQSVLNDARKMPQ